MSLSKLVKDPMEYSKGYPCLYGLRGELYIRKGEELVEVIKNGSSFHIANRKSGAITYFPVKPHFEYVIVLDKNCLLSDFDLYKLDSEFVDFFKRKGLGEYYIEREGGTEWFYLSCPFSYLDLRLEFLQEKGISYLSIFTDDPYPIRDLTHKERIDLQEEDSVRTEYRRKVQATQDERVQRLLAFQEPHIQDMRYFLQNGNVEAALAVAVCGYGKTVVTVKSIKGIINKLFICVPTEYLKKSWKHTLLKYEAFQEDEIVEIGGKGESDSMKIQDLIKKPRYAFLLCYASSPLLEQVLTNDVELGIFDEAHSLAGIASMSDGEDDVGEVKKQDIGRTKRLIRKCADLHVKRLSLTFTPKAFIQDESFKGEINSNDNVELFGNKILTVSLRDMIDKKLLPPYKIRFPHVKKMYEGTMAKVQLMLKEFLSQDESGKFFMNKLIVFGGNHNHCKEIIQCLNELLPENHPIKLIYLDSASSVSNGIKIFTEAERTILVNCQLVGVGVDIPCADSVCILCNKESYTQIVQNLLRPGRAFPGKGKFYMIMALNDDDDVDFIGYVLDALAQIDPLLDRQIMRFAVKVSRDKKENSDIDDVESSPLEGLIHSDEADGRDLVKVRKCLENVIRRRVGNITTRGQFEEIRRICKESNVQNTSSYNLLRQQYTWQEKPWSIRDMTAYEFFHGVSMGSISQDVFKEAILTNNVPYDSYSKWRESNSQYPSVEDINDGYFGSILTNLQELFPQTRQRRR